MRIMVVDDEPDMEVLFRQRFRRAIRAGRVTFVFAASGQDALDKLETASGADVVLILSDINMPNMNGLELLEQLKARLPQTPVVMVTAYSDAGKRDESMALGADDYLTKPLDFEMVEDLLKRYGAPL